MNQAASIAAVLCLGALAAGCTRFDYGSGRPPAPVASAPRQPVSEGGGLQPLVVAPNQDQAGRYGSGPYRSGGTMGPDGRPVGEDGRPYYDPNLGPADGQQQPGTNVASANPSAGADIPPAPAGAPEIGRTEMLGGWTIAAAGSSCKLFMTLTTWSGGYRANTQGCGGPPLGAISAWDLNGSQIILKDGDGTRIATLYKSGNERYDGRTGTGQPISVSR